MNTDLNTARQLLDGGGFTCVLCKDGGVRTATARGVKPLMDWLEHGAALRGFSAADKVVGKATAFLYCLLGVKAVYARVMSNGAMEILRGHGIDAQAGELVPFIINRQGNGPCPMEQAVDGITDSREALTAIEKKLQQLQKK